MRLLRKLWDQIRLNIHMIRWNKVDFKKNGLPKVNFTFNFPIRIKLFLFFLVVSIVPIAIIGYMSYYSSRNAMTRKITEYSLQVANRTVANVRLKLNEFDSISSQLFMNNDFIKTVANCQHAFIKNDMDARKKAVISFFGNHMISHKDIDALLFISKDGYGHSVVVAKDYQNEFSNFIESFHRGKSFQYIIKSGGSIVWSAALKIKNDNYVMLGRSLKDPDTGEPMGVLGIFLAEDKLDRVINFHLYDKLDFSMENISNYSMIIDSNGIIISSFFKDDIGKNIGNLMGNIQFLNNILKGTISNRDYGSELNQGSTMGSINHKNALVVYKSIGSQAGIGGNSRWHLLSFTFAGYLYKEAQTAGFGTLILGIIVASLSLIISIFVSFNVSRSLNQVMNAMEQAEEGNLSTRVSIKTRDEFGYLGKSFNRMNEKISLLINDSKTIIQDILSKTEVLEKNSWQSFQSAHSIAMAMEDISKGTMEQTNESEGSSILMVNLARQIENVVAKSMEVEEINTLTKNLSFQSKEAVQLLMNKTGETGQITKEIIKDMVEFGERAVEIGNITETITNLSEQINLLALNAAIEAARAGEAGRGFAIVAKEVNKLAALSRDAADSINNVLVSIQEKSASSTKTVNRAYGIINEQINAVQHTRQSFDNIISEMNNAIVKITDMNAMIQQINQYKDQTMQSIVNISTVSEEVAASAEEVTASTGEQTAVAEQVKKMAEELRDMAERLVADVSKFEA